MEKKPGKTKKPKDKEESSSKAPAEKGAEDSIVVTAAKAIGTAAGKVAALATTALENLPAKSQKIGKLPKKNKSRLPRRQKKAKQKAATRL